MAGEQTLTLRLKVDDQGSVILDQFTKKIQTAGQSIQNSLGIIKLDSLINLGQRAVQAGEQIYNFTRGIASAASENFTTREVTCSGWKWPLAQA